MAREEKLMEIIKNLNVLVFDLIPLIVQYEKQVKWETSAPKTWKCPAYPLAMTTDQNHLYVCSPDNLTLLIYNLNGEMLSGVPGVERALSIDFDMKESLLYIVDVTHVSIFNLNFIKVGSWKLPAESREDLRGLKVEQKIVYLTLYDVNQIFVCQSQDGKIVHQWGEKGSGKGQLDRPLGITVNKKYIYICDCWNHRIQAFTKLNRNFFFSKKQ